MGAGPWCAPGDMTYSHVCYRNGELVCRITGPATESILPVIADGRTPECPKMDVAPDVSLADMNQRLFDQETFKDVKFVLDDGEEMAHKAVLAAASEVFAAMFASKMQEGATGEVVVQG